MITIDDREDHRSLVVSLQAHAVAPALDFVMVEYTVETVLIVFVCVTSGPVTVCTDVVALPVFVTYKVVEDAGSVAVSVVTRSALFTIVEVGVGSVEKLVLLTIL
jgi:hypothetical protein